MILIFIGIKIIKYNLLNHPITIGIRLKPTNNVNNEMDMRIASCFPYNNAMVFVDRFLSPTISIASAAISSPRDVYKRQLIYNPNMKDYNADILIRLLNKPQKQIIKRV